MNIKHINCAAYVLHEEEIDKFFLETGKIHVL